MYGDQISRALLTEGRLTLTTLSAPTNSRAVPSSIATVAMVSALMVASTVPALNFDAVNTSPRVTPTTPSRAHRASPDALVALLVLLQQPSRVRGQRTDPETFGFGLGHGLCIVGHGRDLLAVMLWPGSDISRRCARGGLPSRRGLSAGKYLAQVA